ncbi:MAG: hypothetical protein V1660_03185 [archaeon]
MAKLIDLREESRKRSNSIETLTYFLKEEIQDNDIKGLSVERTMHMGEVVDIKICKEKWFGKEEVMQIRDDGTETARLESIRVLNIGYKEAAFNIAKRYEMLFNKGEVSVYIN